MKMPKHRHHYTRSRSLPSSRQNSEEENSSPKRRKEDRDDLLRKILHTVENLSKRVDFLEVQPTGAALDEGDTLSLMADQIDLE